MAKFMLVRFSVMVEITDAGALREAALEKFDADDSTYGYPDTADRHGNCLRGSGQADDSAETMVRRPTRYFFSIARPDIPARASRRIAA
jgi:hypothetical protein